MDKENKIIQGDCIEVMKEMEDESVDLIVTSPPYNLGNNFHSNSIRYESYEGDDMKEKEYRKWQTDFLNECYRVLKEKGSMWYNHKVRIKNGIIKHPIEWLNKSNFYIKQEIVWNQKKGANVDKCRCFPFSERIWWLTKRKDVKVFNKNNYKDVWNIVPKHNRKDYNHPAIMAREVVERILSLHENINLVLDPFVGSGTTAVIAKELGINYTGIDISEKYCEIARERVKSVQPNLL